MKTKSRIYYLAIIGLLGIQLACSHATLKTFVDPAIQANSVKSIAVFAMRNTALSPGESLELDKAITQGLLVKNPSIFIISSTEVNTLLNEADLVGEYSKFLYDFEHSGIPNIVILKKIGEKLGVDAILQGNLYDVFQRDGSYISGASATTSLTLRYTLLSTKTGSTLWEGTSSAKKTGATTFSKAPPIYEVITIAQKKLFDGLPTLGK